MSSYHWLCPLFVSNKMLTQVLPSTLPHIKYPTQQDANDPWQKAYRICLQREAQAETQVEYMRARVLGYLIREAPYDESRDTVCQEINSCVGDTAFSDLANIYIRFLAQVFHSSWGPTPYCDFMGSSLNSDIEEAPHTKCREQALKRDNHRCMVTGAYSNRHYRGALHSGTVGAIEVAYILPRSIDVSITKREDTAELGAIMQRFGRINPEELSGDKVHRLENIMTLWDPIHSLFGDLDIWFEPSDHDPYECTVKSSYPRETVGFKLPESFKMTTADLNLPRPSPDYLRLRAACARVAHLSGVSEYVLSLYRDFD
ncbi:hypothetical protein JVU11DRAFT_11365 [Chiua virens]|nr:hypothetical protein JVU11DRAFT_11365 [Chiua virens]